MLINFASWFEWNAAATAAECISLSDQDLSFFEFEIFPESNVGLNFSNSVMCECICKILSSMYENSFLISQVLS